ncbi:MAG: protein-L-isoaspartate O-methyltransferase [Alphaproteobacteria bacterium]|nr:protein-L-isoaspartate O-methyltransferase [Alphaproteobacteria bacterium]
MPDYAQQRLTMVDAQVRTNDVTDPRIHAAMREIPREKFLPSSRSAIAYADRPVDVAPNRYLLDPRTFSKLLQLADIGEGDHVLDVACATGYSTAVISRLAKSVAGLEQDTDLVRLAVESLRAVGASNATVVQGIFEQGVRDRAPFDVVFINGAIQVKPETLLGQLAEGGRLVAIRQDDAQGHAELFVRRHDRVGARFAFDANAPLLSGFTRSRGFVF